MIRIMSKILPFIHYLLYYFEDYTYCSKMHLISSFLFYVLHFFCPVSNLPLAILRKPSTFQRPMTHPFPLLQ